MPEPDWTWAFDADAHRNTDPANQVQISGIDYQENEARKFFNNGLFEKVVLLSLIIGIFSSVLPGIEISNLRMVIGVAIIVILNTVITEWFGRHGMSFDTAMKEFIGVALANFIVVLIYNFVLRRSEGHLQVGATLFFVFLVSIIIALFDRYRPIYLRRVAAEKEIGLA